VGAEETTSNAPHVEPGRVSFARLGEVELAIVSYPIDAERLGPALGRLTDAEQDVLARILRGERNAAIAAARGTSVPTVKKQISSLLRRLRVSSRAEVAAIIGRGR
jgi:DNA-binding NarL/FixJ family response regulator